MRNLIQRFMIFMQGRYGADALGGFLTALVFVIWFVNIFVFDRLASLILTVVQLGILALIIVRALSRNINARSRENRVFMKFFNPIKNWFSMLWKKWRDRENYRYIKCPSCKAQLRVKNNPGKHTVRCPKCGKEFSKRIR